MYPPPPLPIHASCYKRLCCILYQIYQVASRNNVKVRYVDMSGSAGPANLAAVITDNTSLVMIESPTNPMQRIINISDICRVAHSKNALVEVDSTMMTPCLQKPLVLGADLVVHSATKFISGHADVMAGVVVTKNQALSEQVRVCVCVRAMCLPLSLRSRGNKKKYK